MKSFTSLLEPQLAHAKTLLDSIYFNGFALDESHTGTGKTYVACAIAKELNCPVVVVCPKVVIPTWKKLLTKFGVDGALVINYELLIRGNTKWMSYDKAEYFKKANWESKGMILNFPKNSLVILDEVHKCKAKTSLCSDFLIACTNHKYKRLKLSATPATTVLELKALGYSANLHTGYNFSKFCQMSGAEYNNFGSLMIDMTSDKALEGMLRVHDNLFNIQKCASRMTTKMFAGIFPENHVIAEMYDMGANTSKINAVYEQMEYELNSLDERSADYSQHVFAVIIKARRKAELLKVPSLVETITDWYDEGISPVVFLNFSDSIAALYKRLQLVNDLDGKIGFIHGDQKDSEREQDIADFNADLKRIMLVNMAAGNAGVSLHDLNGKHPRNSLIIPSFSAFHLLQALGRIARQGGLTKCYQKIVFSAGTIEERICEKVQGRLDNLSALCDGDLASDIALYR